MCHIPSPLFLVTLNMTQIGSGRERNQKSWLISSSVKIVVYYLFVDHKGKVNLNTKFYNNLRIKFSKLS